MPHSQKIFRLSEATVLVLSGPSGEGDFLLLARELLSFAARHERDLSSLPAGESLGIAHDDWGAPLLLSDNVPAALSVSCSRQGGITWVAMCPPGTLTWAEASTAPGDNNHQVPSTGQLPIPSLLKRQHNIGRQPRLGIDAASAKEFGPGYPCSRVFSPGELESLLPFVSASRTHAAALGWALKEAAVKAIGTGFHRFRPDEVKVHLDGTTDNSIHASVTAGITMPGLAVLMNDIVLALCLC